MRRPRKYTLYKRERGNVKARWIRISNSSWPLGTARTVYREDLIANSLRLLEPDMEYRIKPVR